MNTSPFRYRTTGEQDVTYIARLNFLTDVFGDEHGELSAGFDEDTRFYLHAWNPSDGVVALDDHEIPAGGCWWTWGTEELHGRGFVDAKTPELAIAVEARFGGRGVAKALLQGCFDALKAQGVPQVSLCVSHENDRARGVYERIGFELVRTEEDYQIMLKQL